MGLKWKIAQSLEIKWWQRYLKTKSPEEYFTWKDNYWKEFLQKIKVKVGESDSVLDAGCGPAGIFIHFSKNEVVAVDPLLDQYDALPHFSKENYSNVNFIAKPLEQATIPQVDFVFCLNAINHVEDLEVSMDKICDAAKAGGTMILSIDAHNWKGLKHIFRALPGDALHPHQYDKTEYSKMLEKRGFTITNEVLIKSEFIFDYWALVARKV